MTDYNRYIPEPTLQNSSFQLSNDNKANRLMNDYVTEGLTIGGTPIKVFKLLGIHEQQTLTALTGKLISNGEYPDYPTINLQLDDCSEWRSIKHCGKRSNDTFIGYDFGPILYDDGGAKYAIDTQKKYHVTSVFIQQSELSNNRITKARVENSEDGKIWKGISLLNLPDDGDEHWLDIKQSYPARYWRIVPTVYTGSDDDLWIVKKFALSEYLKTNITNIQDNIFMENRDRSYSMDPIDIKAFYSLIDITTDLTQYGIQLSDQYTFKFGFNLTINKLKRPIVIGDILEIPCEVQYDINMNPVRKYLEITDVGWDSSGFTPGWQSTIYSVIAKPMIASQETMDIVGDLNNDFFENVLDTYNSTALKVSNNIKATANTNVPEFGANINDTVTIPEDIVQNAANHGVDLAKLNPDPHGYGLEDAMPPNNAPYTEGDEYPKNPSNGDYHRLTYSKISDPIPPRLYQYSSKKNRWIFLESDKRFASNSKKPQLEQYLNSGIDITKIVK